MLKVIGFIPCRSGSKRIVDKNLSLFNSKSLIQNIYNKAELANCIDHIVVSTDSAEYLDSLSKGSKYLDIGLRSKKNSMDDSTDYDVLKEVLEKLKSINLEFQYIIHLRPTYPALLKENIDHAFNFFQNEPKATSLKSVEKLDLYYQKCLIQDTHDSNKLIGLDGDERNYASSIPSQKCQNIYAQTAAIDIYKKDVIKSGELWGNYCLKYEFGNVSADIDNYFDYPMAYNALDQLDIKKKIKNGEQVEICCDIDGVLFSRTSNNQYDSAFPNIGIINLLTLIKNNGIKVVLHTARGSKTGKNWEEFTKKQLAKYDIPFDELKFGKPGSDFYIDDKSITMHQLKKMFNL